MKIALFPALFIVAGSACASGPENVFHVEAGAIADEVRVETIGFLAIVGERGETRLETYVLEGQDFQPAAEIPLEDTTPVSSFGYQPPHDPKHLNKGQYPILEASDGYLRIATDPRSGESVWVREEAFPSTEIVLLEAISQPVCCADLFFFAGSGQVAVHEGADSGSRVSDLDRREGRYSSGYYILEVQGDFALLADSFLYGETRPLSDAALGWVRIKDDDGRLLLWFW